MGFSILGTGSALPEKVLTNDDIARLVETDDEWIRERTGIGMRHVSEKDTVASLAIDASVKALEMAGISGEEIDLVILASCSTEDNTPSAACHVQAAIGAINAAAFDINSACTGFLTALTIVDAYMQAGTVNTALVIGSETLSKIVDWTDRGTCILFGDGAGAAVIRKNENNKFIYTLGADGEKKDALICEKCGKIRMDGKAVYRFATTVVPKCIQTVLDKAGISADRVDRYLLHQANSRIIESIAKKLGQKPDKFPMNLERMGNMSSASIPVLLDEQCRAGSLSRGETILMSGFGAGLTYGACIMTW